MDEGDRLSRLTQLREQIAARLNLPVDSDRVSLVAGLKLQHEQQLADLVAGQHVEPSAMLTLTRAIDELSVPQQQDRTQYDLALLTDREFKLLDYLLRKAAGQSPPKPGRRWSSREWHALDAARLIDKLEAEDRDATPEETVALCNCFHDLQRSVDMVPGWLAEKIRGKERVRVEALLFSAKQIDGDIIEPPKVLPPSLDRFPVLS